MTQDLDALARRIALPYYEAALPGHDRYHAGRVRDLALRLAEDCDRAVDREVLAAAAWLHDVGRPLERTGEVDHHDRWAASEAADRLATEGVTADRADAVADCVRAHSIRASSPAPETVEAELLFDADKLDAVGALGLVRMACIVGERSGRAGEAYASVGDAAARDGPTPDRPDLDLLREWGRERLEAVHTDPARRLGAARWAFVEDFFAQVERELAGDER